MFPLIKVGWKGSPRSSHHGIVVSCLKLIAFVLAIAAYVAFQDMPTDCGIGVILACLLLGGVLTWAVYNLHWLAHRIIQRQRDREAMHIYTAVARAEESRFPEKFFLYLRPFFVTKRLKTNNGSKHG